MNAAIRVLIVEDNPGDAALIGVLLERSGGREVISSHATTLAEALDCLRGGRFDAVLLDITLPDSTGLEPVKAILAVRAELPIVVLSGLADERFSIAAVQAGAQDYLLKGQCDGALIVRSIRYAIARSRAEMALVRSESRFRTVFEGVAIGMGLMSADGQLLETNPALRKMLGYSAVELVGRSFAELVHPADRDPADSGPNSRFSLAALAKGEPARMERRFMRRNGETLWAEINISAFRDSGDEAPYMVVMVEDVTERRRAEDALLQAKQEAERANLSRTKFFAAASHDLKQPLHAMGLFLSLLAMRVTEERSREILDALKASHQAMEKLLYALLDISKLDAGVTRPDIREFPVGLLLNRMKVESQSLAREKGLDLRVVWSSAIIRSDPDLIERVLRNLVVNAIRYTRAGRVLIGCRRRRGALRIDVIDTGIGIPSSKLNDIFREFYQVDKDNADKAEGLGLGLAIVERIARLLGHRVDVVSSPGKGSRFSIEVAAIFPDQAGRRSGQAGSRDQGGNAPEDCPPAGATPQRHGAAHYGQDDRIVLVIDDQEMARKAMRELVKGWGWRVMTACDAEDALAQIRGCGDPPDAIVADFNLTKTNGIAEMRRICRTLGTDIPGVVVSGDSEAAKRTRSSGYPFLPKPVAAERLLAILERSLGAAPILRG